MSLQKKDAVDRQAEVSTAAGVVAIVQRYGNLSPQGVEAFACHGLTRDDGCVLEMRAGHQAPNLRFDGLEP